MHRQKIPLPIDQHLESILKEIQKSSTILIKASPGSGKTTRLPWFLAQNLTGKVLVLEPRRLAARLAAQRIAEEENLELGEAIGIHFRFEKKYAPESKVIFYTEGTFIKACLMNPSALRDVSAVILDEFHERHVETDFALAALRGQQVKNPDLKLILMSATLDLSLLKDFKEPAIIDLLAPNFPVEVYYLDNIPSVMNRPWEVKIKEAIQKLPPDSDTLVFLPGMREILRTKEYLGEQFGIIRILHSEISSEEQQLAISPNSKRKIILSSAIAESSITIPGVKAVIDCGVGREAAYSPWNGLKYLRDYSIPKSSAIQRSGRAGRTAPGVCFRLYSKLDFESRPEFNPPEIEKADLTDLYLTSLRGKNQLLWASPPPEDRWQKAKKICFMMGFINSENQLSPLVSELETYPVELRVARALIAAQSFSIQEKKNLINFICYEIETGSPERLKQRLNFFLKDGGTKACVWQKALLHGFLDQIARFRSKHHDFVHYSGKNLKAHHSLKHLQDGLYLIFEISQRQEVMKVIEVEEEWLWELDPFPFEEEKIFMIDEEFSVNQKTKIGSIVFEETSKKISLISLNPSEKEKVIELASNPFKKRWQDFQSSENYCRYLFGRKINICHAIEEVSFKNYLAFSSEFSWNLLSSYFDQVIDLSQLDRMLPTKLNLPGRRELRIHYPPQQDPYLEAPIQDFYGLAETPSIGNPPFQLTLRILGPHKRPIQVTKDLKNFWSKTYQEMVKELKRDYPRHFWPDDPANAKPKLLARH